MKNILNVKEDNTEKVGQLYTLLLKGNTLEECASVLDVSFNTIINWRNLYYPFLKDLALFKEHKTDIYIGLQNMTVKELAKKIPHAAPRDLITILGLLEDKVNLREGRSTANVSLNIRMEDLVKKKQKIIDEMKEEGMDDYDIQKNLPDRLQLPQGSRLPLKEMEQVVADSKPPMQPALY